MKRICLFFLFLITTPALLHSQTLMIPEDGRSITSLNGSWNSIIDPFETGYYNYRYKPKENGYFVNEQKQNKSDLIEYNFEKSKNLQVPGDWNTQRKELFFYEGSIWYQKKFDYNLPKDKRLFLWVGGANYEALAWLNDKKLGEHTGGFTPFWFEITDRIKSSGNDLIFKVDNKRKRGGVPTVNFDWWNFGGLTRDVMLVEVPKTFIQDYTVGLNQQKPNFVRGDVSLNGPNGSQKVTVSIPEADVKSIFRTNNKGKGTFSISAPDLKRWSPKNPKLYEVQISTPQDTVSDKIGFRTIDTKGEQILLNGEKVFLKGISLHEVTPLGKGRAYRPEEARTLLKWAKEMGANFVRLAHYPHNRYMTKMADKMGLMIWSEIPIYWTVQWENKDTYQLAEQQLTEMIERDKNRSSVVIWSVGNETPRGDTRNKFMSNLIEKARELDSTRLISAATQPSFDGKTIILDDPISKKLDVIGVNEYLGWYGGTPEGITDYSWKSKFNKPVVISEFGASAKYGFHGDKKTRWSEEYQAAVYRNQFKMFEDISFLAGIIPWILTDFLSPRRPLPDKQDYFNRKGLISEQGYKKEAYYILQDYYKNEGYK